MPKQYIYKRKVGFYPQNLASSLCLFFFFSKPIAKLQSSNPNDEDKKEKKEDYTLGNLLDDEAPKNKGAYIKIRSHFDI